MADGLDNVLRAFTHVALPSLDHDPVSGFEVRAFPGISFSVQLELAGPECGVGLGYVRIAARAVMPVATVDEDRQAPTWIGDVGSARCLAPGESVATQTRVAERAAESQFGTRIARTVRTHDVADGWAARRWVWELKSSHSLRGGALRHDVLRSDGRRDHVPDENLGDPLYGSDHQRVAHHECALPV